MAFMRLGSVHPRAIDLQAAGRHNPAEHPEDVRPCSSGSPTSSWLTSAPSSKPSYRGWLRPSRRPFNPLLAIPEFVRGPERPEDRRRPRPGPVRPAPRQSLGASRASLPRVAHWIDGEPLDDQVVTVAKIEDRIRHYHLDGEPIATGVVAVGDAWACTGPHRGRGATIGMLHGLALSGKPTARRFGYAPGPILRLLSIRDRRSAPLLALSPICGQPPSPVSEDPASSRRA
jgi:hypothetical protein